MPTSTYKPFGSVITNSQGSVDFSADAGFKFVSENKPNKNKYHNDQEGMMDIFNSAVGDFTERPLQIMIREIAKNLLIFTPVGWIVLLFIIARRYKGKLSYAFKNMNGAICDAANSLLYQEVEEDEEDDSNEEK
jgi:hypothetical protein